MFSNTLNATNIIKELLNTKSCLSKWEVLVILYGNNMDVVMAPSSK